MYLTYCELERHNRASKSYPYTSLITRLRSKAIPSIHPYSQLSTPCSCSVRSHSRCTDKFLCFRRSRNNSAFERLRGTFKIPILSRRIESDNI